jgi:hypothetical protein
MYKDGTSRRRQRHKEIKVLVTKLLNRYGGIMSLKKCLAHIDYELGLRPKKSMEFLESQKHLKVFDFDEKEDFITFHRGDLKAYANSDEEENPE